MSDYTPEYTLTLDIDGTIHIVRPEELTIDVYDPDHGADDGIPSHILHFTRTEFPGAVARALLAGIIVD